MSPDRLSTTPDALLKRITYAQAAALLTEARALAGAGKFADARAKVREADALKVAYGWQDWTPTSTLRHIASAEQTHKQREAATQATRRRTAREVETAARVREASALLQAAEAALKKKDFPAARQKAQAAQKVKVSPDQLPTNPEALLKRISYAQAAALLAEARDLADAGKFPEARAKIREADALKADYGWRDWTPANTTRHVASVEQKQTRQKAEAADKRKTQLEAQRAEAKQRELTRLLASARTALAKKQFQAARDAVQKAKKLDVRSGPHAGAADSLGSRIDNAEARALLADAQRLCREGQFDDAVTLVNKADSMNASWGWFETKPAHVREAVAQARRESKTKQELAKKKGVEHRRQEQLAERRQQALKLLAEANQALQAKKLDQAEALIQQAEQTRVPLRTTDPHPPDALRAKIAQARRANQEQLKRQRYEQAKQLLQQAHEMVKQKDFDKAETLAKKAKGLNASYGWFEETPDGFLSQTLRRAREAYSATLTEKRDSQRQATLRAEALGLLRQAQAALKKGDLKGAEEIARRVAQMGVPYQAGDVRPATVLGQIEQARKQADARRDAEARRLVQQAQKAMDTGRFDEAEKLARKAKALDARYGWFDKTPAGILAALPDRRRQHQQALAAKRKTEQAEAASRQAEAKRKAEQAEVASRQAEAKRKAEQAEAASRQAEAKRKAEQAQVASRQAEAKRKAEEAEDTGRRTAAAVAAKTAPAPTAAPPVRATVAQATTRPSPASRPTAPRAVAVGPAPASVREQKRRLGRDLLKRAYDDLREGAFAKARQRAKFLKQDPEYGLTLEATKLLAAIEVVLRDEAMRLYRQGLRAAEAGQTRKAIELLEAVVDLDVSLGAATDRALGKRLAALRLRKSRDERLAMAPGRAAGPADREKEKRVRVQQLLVEGQRAVATGKYDLAAKYYEQALRLDPKNAEAKEGLTKARARAKETTTEESLMQKVLQAQKVEVQCLRTDVADAMIRARRRLRTDPRASIQTLTVTLEAVKAAGKTLKVTEVEALRRRVEHALERARAAKEDFDLRSIEEQERKARQADVERRTIVRRENQASVDQLMEKWNALMNERKYEDAMTVAKQALLINPNSIPAQTALWKANKQRKILRSRQYRDERKEQEYEVIRQAEESNIGRPAKPEMVYPPAKEWEELTRNRMKYKVVDLSVRTPKTLEIESKLHKPVVFDFTDSTLSDVVDFLRDFTGVNIVLDKPALEEQGISDDTTVNMKLAGVSLKAALRLILDQIDLTYLIKDDVILITSTARVTGELQTRVYPVADLVVPIPNQEAGSGSGGLGGAQGIGGRSGDGGGGGGGGFGGGGGGGGGGDDDDDDGGGDDDDDNLLDDELAELIESVIAPNSWDTVGGPGSVKYFEANMTLVISQTPDVHEQIKDLLEQLRRLQDLQVTMEVHIVNLSESFVESMGLDFDMRVRTFSHANIPPLDSMQRRDPEYPWAVGIRPDADGSLITGTRERYMTFSSDANNYVAREGMPTTFLLDPTTLQTANGVITGGFQFGGAIINDIELYYFLHAVQHDERSNLSNTPLVTAFNGKWATVSSSVDQPFVAEYEVEVEEGAAALTPTVETVPVGVELALRAVISADRRYVRITVEPFVTAITGFFTATATAVTSGAGGSSTVIVPQTVPIIRIQQVLTTVSVPDRGHIILGGLKRMNEERIDSGTPVLGRIPWLNRLYSAYTEVRSVDSLLFIISPRIIIQEEEEAKLGKTSFQ